MDPVTIHGAFFTIFIPLSVFLIIYEEMVREKMLNLRLGLLAIGCSNTAFWISWMITSIAFSAIMAVLIYGFGYWFMFDFFYKSPFYIIFAIYFVTSLSYCGIAAMLTTIMSHQKMAYTISYLILLISVI